MTATPAEAASPTARVLLEVLDERYRQDARWGEQNHPDGTGPDVVWAFTGPASWVRESAKATTDRMAEAGVVTWRDIALEEFAEAIAEEDAAALRGELVQLAAVCVQWVQAIDRRATTETKGTDRG
jgi:hypothetical protein